MCVGGGVKFRILAGTEKSSPGLNTLTTLDITLNLSLLQTITAKN